MDVQTTAVTEFQRRTDSCLMHVDRATKALQQAREDLSIEGLEDVAITIEALKARGKLLRDERAKQAAYDFEVDRLVSAAWIAQRIIDRDKLTYTPGRGHSPRPLSASGLLLKVGWSQGAANKATAVARLKRPELVAARKKRVPIETLIKATRGRGARRRRTSDPYARIISGSSSNGGGLTAMRTVTNTMPLDDFDDITDPAEIISIRNRLTEIRDWCDARIKQLKVKR